MIVTMSSDCRDVTEYTSKYPCIPIECREFNMLYSSYGPSVMIIKSGDEITTCPAVSMISILYSWFLILVCLEKLFSIVG